MGSQCGTLRDRVSYLDKSEEHLKVTSRLRRAQSAVVLLGSVNRYFMPILRSASEIRRLNSYDPFTLKDDISLIKLNQSVSFSSNVKPIQLPSRSKASDTYWNKVLIVSGFGLTTTNQVSTTLQYSEVAGISNSECRNIYGSMITSSILCTRGYPNSDQGSCQGDSGGPLIIGDNSTLVGIVSFGAAQSCTAGYPQGFTRVGPYLGWISNTTGIALKS